MTFTPQKLRSLLSEKMFRNYSVAIEDGTPKMIYMALASVISDLLLERQQRFSREFRSKGKKRVYYLCMEFLLGRQLKNNMFNLGVEAAYRAILGEAGFELDDIYEIESDAGLGNGGLGRLAACFMDALVTEDYPAMGFTLRYEYGLFKQKIVDNIQVELPDYWLDTGSASLIPRSDKMFEVKLGGTVREEWTGGKLNIVYENASVVDAMPYDLIISGYGTESAGVLRLWQASAPRSFDMQYFSQGRFMEAMRYDNEAELISKVLYPADEQYSGKQLRLSQQYLLCSASLQSIFKDFFRDNTDLDDLPNKAAIHINDTHPALAIPELMRLLVDEHGYPWEKAWNITVNTIAYTNHTVLSEALEKWQEELVRSRLPRIYSIIKEIDARFKWEHGTLPDEALCKMTVIGNGQIRMANLAIIGSHSVNGVSALHSEIIKKDVFHDFYQIYPERFTNVTNGIAHRRWLSACNPRLDGLVKDLIGDGYMLDAPRLKELERFMDDKRVLAELGRIKRGNKEDFAAYIKQTTGAVIDPGTRFDTQIKRLHEYKRQLLNALKIIKYYLDIKDNAGSGLSPQTFIFGAKAAGSYMHAKRIITLLNCLSHQIQTEKKVKERLNVLFVENYNVTKAERLIPASEVSEQISLAGKEASGTSNMKFMLNGAVTLGTVDGANVEILENVGERNMFPFGLRAEEVEKSWQDYSPSRLYAADPDIRRVVDALKVGFDGESFQDIADYLTVSFHYVADPYMCLADFSDYLAVAAKLDRAYANHERWNRMALKNIANAGVFAADRSIAEYADRIWRLNDGRRGRQDK
ncbi:MAG: glycogen/starch/alpha-glucan phosphorylase [Clostridiales bacterium]|jgi:starch phosphorylase|nr:glycogen/starch/alpha-glucan phosphorylase [Clostridiales bacterium]